MALLYAAYLARCPDQPCPCTERCQPRDQKAFRFMHNPASEKDFVPPAMMPGVQVKATDKCGRFALSFFESLERAQRRYRLLAERLDAVSRYGDQIGEIDLTKKDGLMTLPDKHGHMDLYQEENVMFASRVTSYSPVVN